ncbi:MAG: hypothetical protein OHK0053_33510 [Microscillaceae bacterium]
MQAQNQQISRQNQFILYGLAGLLGVGLVSVFMFYLYWMKQKNNRMLLQKNREIEEQKAELMSLNEALTAQNEEIEKQKALIQSVHQHLSEANKKLTDSILTARTIQQALLPFEARLRRVTADYFLIFQPKDIVSGDFVWVGQVGQKRIVSVIDCTGHGVPGGFMTMFAYAFLNELILEKKMSDPALALQKLNAYLSYAFAQERHEINYQLGVELSIFCFSRTPPETHWQCTFAASKQNLLYTTPTGLVELRGDRATIGSNNMGKDLEFTRHEFSLPPGEMVYLTTDGFLDTPNPARKKISSSALKETLWQKHTLKTSQQKEALWELLQQHRQQEDYRDDITMLGLRL